MTMIEDLDFSKINAFEGTQHDSFEELICVLAKREQPENAKEFRRMGRGPDGGVEAIWYLNDGRKIAYQAKFLLSLRSNWNQITESVKRALEVHPELKEYIVALPIAPTGSTTKDKNKKSGWDIWDEKIEEWNNLAAEKGMAVEFKLWTKTDLIDKLSTDENASLLQLWFGETVLNDSWFQKQVKIATKALDNRYNPADHVKVSIETLFDTIVRGPEIQQKIDELFSEIKSVHIENIDFSELEYQPDSNIWSLENEHKKALQKLISQQSLFTTNISKPWNLKSVERSLQHFKTTRDNLSDEYSKINEKIAGTGKRIESGYAKGKLSLSCQNLNTLIKSKHLSAEALRCAVVHGPAGAGKSHVFGHIAEQRTEKGLPTMLLLGQDFSNASLWDQIGARLKLERRTPEIVLGALNSAGERKKTRTLLLIDAINEGAGANYWKNKIPELLEHLRKYPHLGILFSCRQEYLHYAIPENLKNDLPQIQLEGFSTIEEIENAAIEYLDKQSIARPNTLWHSPEFFNPLFLRSVSKAMADQKKKEFPSGMYGVTKLITVYLDSLCYQPPMRDSNPAQMKGVVIKLVQKLAADMVSRGRDYVALDDANEITDECFRGIQPHPGKSWIQSLIEASLFRLDPPPYSENIDPLNPPSDLIRFAFQRFQDYLIADSLILGINPDQLELALKEKSGVLKFLFHDGKVKGLLNHTHAGILEALSVLFPEKFGSELVTLLPNWEETWYRQPLIQGAFSESCKWRHKDAFSDETLEVFNRLQDNRANSLELLLNVAMMVEHPWNADFLQKNLQERNLTERDCIWTRQIDLFYENKRSNIERIISWASSCLDRSADSRHLELASLVLTWLLSSSNRPLRDSSTKALATIFLKRPEIFHFLLEKISDCDDPYIIERFYAAAFGACCNDPDAERLKSYSSKVYEKVFAEGKPPVALLTRDYALGIIELADYHQACDVDINIDVCRPPYRSEEPNLNITEAEVNELADQNGGNPILYSAHKNNSSWSSILTPKNIGSFLTIRLSSKRPQLNEEERIEKELCDLWVTKRVYELGWSMNLFPHDGIYSKSYRALEQIGTKYQCIALDELQARLADNFWMAHWSEAPDMYQYSSFHAERDLEPTILPELARFQMENRGTDDWLLQPIIQLPQVAENDLKEWPFQDDPAENIKKKLLRSDGEGKPWWILHEYHFEQESYKKEKLGRMDYDPRLNESRAFYCIFMLRNEVEQFIQLLKQNKDFDITSFTPKNFYDGPYLLEAPWRDTWKSYSLFESPGTTPLARFHWGSDLDHSIPKGFEVYMPQQWFAKELGLNISLEDPRVWKDKNGACVIQTERASNNHTVVVIDENRLKTYANKSGKTPIWIMIAERRSHLGGLYSGKGIYSSRKALGVAWLEGDDLKQEHWLVEVKRDGR